MLYHLEQGPVEKKIIAQCQREQLPLPSKIANAPELYLGLEFVYDAFAELNSCRTHGMSEGPIPWTAMNTYCGVYGVEGEAKQDFFYLVRALDNAYLDYQAEKQKKKSKVGGKKPMRGKR